MIFGDFMNNSGETDIQLLIEHMHPHLSDEVYVVVSVQEDVSSIPSFAQIREKEGITLILTSKEADKRDISYEQKWALISLDVYSSLQAVGFTAIISKALSDNGISVNVIAGFYHDHLLVPYSRKQEAYLILKNLF